MATGDHVGHHICTAGAADAPQLIYKHLKNILNDMMHKLHVLGGKLRLNSVELQGTTKVAWNWPFPIRSI